MDTDFRPVKGPPKSVPADSDNLAQTPKPNPESFHTPEEIAAVESAHEDVPLQQVVDESDVPAERPASHWQFKLPHWPFSKREWAICVALVLVCGGLIAIVITHLASKPVASDTKTAAIAPKLPPKPTTVPSNLSGLPVDPSVNQRPVTGVMIENTDQARPQSGLGQAGVVFEAVAEGGITRFLALYQDTAPTNVGPVRSARPYYVQWAMGFDASYAHVGGSPDALADIKAWGVKNLDEFANGGAYHRISSRAAPHNVYTSIQALNQLETSKGYTTSTYTGFARKAESPSKTPTARSINLTLSGPDYNVHYAYNATTNSYDRSEGGAAHADADTKKQLSPKVVVALVVPESRGALDTSGAYYSNYASLGSGAAYIFQDGVVTTATWSKPGNSDPLALLDAKGHPLKLNPGQTWLTAISSSTNLHYTP